jgi:hypothetical protein
MTDKDYVIQDCFAAYEISDETKRALHKLTMSELFQLRTDLAAACKSEYHRGFEDMKKESIRVVSETPPR